MVPELASALETGPFATALRLAIQASGLSLGRIQDRLQQRGLELSLTTLSYWQRGRSQPERADSLRAVEALEEVLGLPAGSLIALVGPPRPRGRRLASSTEQLDVERLWSEHETLNQLIGEVGVAPEREVSKLGVWHQLYIGADRSSSRLRVREVLRAERDRVDRCVVINHADETRGPAPELTEHHYCRPGRTRRDTASGMLVAELFFNHVLSAGDTTIVEYEVSFPAGNEPVQNFSRRFIGRARQYVLQVHFAATAIPVRCYEIDQADIDAPQQRERELRISADHTAHVVAIDYGPGIRGIRWEWD